MVLTVGLSACKEDEPPPEEPDQLEPGDPCDPEAGPAGADGGGTGTGGGTGGGNDGPPTCAPGLSCEPVDGTNDEYVCGAAVEIRGRVIDSNDGEAIEGALVAALNESGEPVTDVVATDSCGDYVLPVSVRRTPDGEFAETPKWTLNVSAQDYLPFPAGLRPALPVDIADVMPDPDPPETTGEASGGEVHVTDVIDNAATNVALIPLPGDQAGGSIVSGHVDSDVAPGMLVVAEETGGRASYGIVDASGNYTLFNVPDGMAVIRGYRRGIEVESVVVMTDGGTLEDADLPVVTTDVDDLGAVGGSLNIVNAPGGSETSVVLIPVSVYNDALERGPVPVGLRVPDPPAAPNVTSDFEFDGVPAGTYKVLVAFENDLLVRDPDEGIAGTAILELTLGSGEQTTLMDSFKVTEALGVVGPGADAPEQVADAMPTLTWMDDSSEDGYQLVVFDALGEIVWETEIAGVSGSNTVDVQYAGDPLVNGMYYQFRATSFRDPPNGDRTFISRTEDLRGVFYIGEADPPAECEADGDTDGAGDTTGG